MFVLLSAYRLQSCASCDIYRNKHKAESCSRISYFFTLVWFCWLWLFIGDPPPTIRNYIYEKCIIFDWSNLNRIFLNFKDHLDIYKTFMLFVKKKAFFFPLMFICVWHDCYWGKGEKGSSRAPFKLELPTKRFLSTDAYYQFQIFHAAKGKKRTNFNKK